MASLTSFTVFHRLHRLPVAGILRQHQRILLPSSCSHHQQNYLSTATTPEARRPLRRPSGYHGGGSTSGGGGGSDSSSNKFSLRSNVVTLFPGDFSDEDGMWDDDRMDDASFFEDDGEEQMSAANLIRQALKEKDAKAQAQKEKWIANSKPPERKSIIDARGRAYGKGGRKTAKATVYIQPGLGEIVVNRKDFVDYFVRRSDRDHILTPLVVTGTVGAWDVQISVRGGGLTGQAGAARLGIANALNAYNPDLYRPPLKRKGLLERDARIVERKNIGHVKARKSPQWVRR